MTKEQENKMSMFVNVQKVTNFHNEVWKDHSGFVMLFKIYEDYIERIRQISMVQEGQITGVTKDKAKMRELMAEKGHKVETAVFAYASFSGNNKLQDRVSYTLSDLKYCRDTAVVDMLNVILTAGKQYLPELELFGIVQSDIDELESLIQNYSLTAEDPRQAITNRSRATAELKSALKEADKILKEQLDKVLFQFKEISFAFYPTIQKRP